MKRARLGAVLVTALIPLLAGTPAAAQEDLAGELGSAAEDVARAWRAGDVDLLAERMATELALHLPDGPHPALSARLARAALVDLHGTLGSGPVGVRQVRLLGGSPSRGFTEMAWSPLADGMTEAVPYTVFVGMERRDGAWRVVEIRVLAGGTAAPSVDASDRDPAPMERWH